MDHEQAEGAGRTGQHDLFRARLDQIIDMKHPLVVLAQSIDWDFLARETSALYRAGISTFADAADGGAAHHIKYMDDLSDEEVCRRFVENSYYQYFCGEEFFQHELPLDRSSMTRWRQRLGEEKMQALLQESLAAAVRLGAAKPSEFTQGVVDTTVQEKNVAHPTDAKLTHQARERLVKLAKKHGLKLRQSPCSGWQEGVDQAATLRPCEAVQAGEMGVAQAEDVAGAGDQGHRVADCRGQDTTEHLPVGTVEVL